MNIEDLLRDPNRVKELLDEVINNGNKKLAKVLLPLVEKESTRYGYIESLLKGREIVADFESRLPVLIKQYKAHNPELSESEAEAKIRELNQYDPTGLKATYTPWIVKQYLEDSSFDLDLAKQVLKDLEKVVLHKKLPAGFDIGKFNLNELKSKLQPILEPIEESEKEKEEIKKEGPIGQSLISEEGYEIIEVTDPKDSVRFCKKYHIRSWCVKDLEYAEFYVPLYFVLKNGSPKGAWSEYDKKLSNRQDLDEWDLDERDFIAKLLRKVRPNLTIKTKEEMKREALNSPEKAYNYAFKVKGRFPEGEPIIAKSPKYAYYYARDVIKERFPKGEPAIAKDFYFACLYAKFVIKGRFLEGEAVIINSNYFDDYVEFLKEINKLDEFLKDHPEVKNYKSF